MRKRMMVGVLLAVLTTGAATVTGCRSMRKAGAVDTTKDVYGDDEVPTAQVQVMNGVTKEVPWSEVPEASRWMFAMKENGSYEFRVPIVRIEGHSTVRKDNGQPCGWTQYYGVNPKYVRTSDNFCNH